MSPLLFFALYVTGTAVAAGAGLWVMNKLGY